MSDAICALVNTQLTHLGNNVVHCTLYIVDPNVQDCTGNTALHHAVENNALEALACLLSRGANSSILNNEMFGPIHMATQLNKIGILEVSASL